MYEENNFTEEIKDTNPQDSQVVNDKPKKRFNWKKFVGYFVLGLVVLGIGYLGYRFYEFKPYRVIVSNVTSRSATISWVTDSAEPGMVVYKEGGTVLPIWISKYGMGNGYDDRDYSNAELEAASKTQENISESEDITADDIETEIVVTELGTYWSHHVTIRNLNPETEYEFMVGDGLVFEKVNTEDTENSMVTTLKEIDEIETPIPAYGIVRYYNNEEFLRINDGIVYLTLNELITGTKSELISSITNDEGGWYVDLTSAYTSDGKKFMDVVADEEYVNIYADMVIEGVQYGRWTKKVAYQYISPVSTIDLYNPDDNQLPTEDEYLEYLGESVELSFLDKLVEKTFAHSNRYGTCSGDVCGCGGQCGFVNSSPCVCKCNGVTKSVGAGTTCQVDQTTETAKTDADITEVPNVLCPRATAGSSTSGGCSGNGGSCYYNSGFTDSKGNYCYNGRWVTETDKEKWNSGGEYSNIAYGQASTTSSGATGTASVVSKKCCGIPAVSNMWLELGLYDTSCPKGREDLTGKVSTCSGTYTGTSSTNGNVTTEIETGGTVGYVTVTNDFLGTDYTVISCEDTLIKDLVVFNKQYQSYWNCGSNHKFETMAIPNNCFSTFVIGGTCCNNRWVSYDIDTGESMFCDTDLRWKKTNFKQEVSGKIDLLEKGETCDSEKYDFCLCQYDSTGEWKINLSRIYNKTDVCGGVWKSSGILRPINKLFAEELDESMQTYLVDTENSMIKGLTPGEYSYEYDGDLYMFKITEDEYNHTGGEFSLYIDLDRDGVIEEEDINLTKSASTIKLATLEKGVVYTLKEGFNFISFPFVFTDEDIKTASNLLTYLNDRYNDAFYSISKYDSGKWTIVGSNGGTYDQNDFQLIPGQGYVLKAKTEISITLYGNEVTYDSSTDSAPIYLSSGWNLVGLYGTGVKSYTAESILTDITNYEPINFTAVNVSRWVESRALYEALQRDTDGTVYGLDFPIELKKSYFIKVTDGEGNWEPGIK